MRYPAIVLANPDLAGANLTALRFHIDNDFTLTSDNVYDLFVHQDNFINSSLLASKEFITEITVCVNFNLDYLLNQVLIVVKNDLSITAEDNSEVSDGDNEFIMFNTFGGVSYMAQIKMQLMPKRWYRYCVAYNADIQRLEIVLDGVLLPDYIGKVNPMNLSLSSLSAQGLSFGFDKYGVINNNSLTTNLFHGTMSAVNIWSKALTPDEMIRLQNGYCSKSTIDNLSYSRPDIFDWSSVNGWNLASTQVEVTGSQNMCNLDRKSGSRLYPVKKYFDDAPLICSSLGGHLAVPEDQEHLESLLHPWHKQDPDGSNTALDNVCSNIAWIGIHKKDGNDSHYVDINGNTSKFLPFLKGQPNGREVQTCLALTASNGGIFYYDDQCQTSLCTLCEVELEDLRFILRGQLPFNIDREFSNNVPADHGMYGFAGFRQSIIEWDEILKTYQIKLLFTSSTEDRIAGTLVEADGHPVGLKTWKMVGNETRELKLTTCGSSGFTCNTFGNCIPIKKRCNSRYDCDDFSDEVGCERVKINFDTYKKEVAPRAPDGSENVEVDIKIVVKKISAVKELEQLFTAKVDLSMSWLDPRLQFTNLKSSEDQNAISHDLGQNLWTPILAFSNSEDGIRTKLDDNAFLNVIREGQPKPNPLTEIYEDQVYEGAENHLILSRMYTITFHCPFDLAWFPFDIQRCPIEMSVPFNLKSHVDIRLINVDSDGELNVTQYVVNAFEYPAGVSGLKVLSADIVMTRVYAYHMFTTFLPTLCLILITEVTLFIDRRHFEATIMVALTSMLVMYTLYQSVGSSLPQTSFLKLIDVWLLVGLVAPFFVIFVLIAMDTEDSQIEAETVLFNKVMAYDVENNQIAPEPKKKKRSVMSGFVTLARIAIPLITFVFIVVFWFVALL